jgi:hypothetical protein
MAGSVFLRCDLEFRCSNWTPAIPAISRFLKTLRSITVPAAALGTATGTAPGVDALLRLA